MKPYLYTHLKARLQLIHTEGGANYNWLFLPGGPGLGSESLSGLTKGLKLPGNLWHLDLPGDGSNTTADDQTYFAQWSLALMEAVTSLNDVILVAHSTGGMYVLATAGLENKLRGLILMDSAPDSSWRDAFIKILEKNLSREFVKLNEKYQKKPSNQLLKQMTMAAASYSFTPKGLAKGISVLSELPFNHQTCDWSAQHFDETYQAQWIPKKIPTLILAGDKDQLTPLALFRKAKKFQRKNIFFKDIKNAGHFPWVENPKAVVNVFQEYSQCLQRQDFTLFSNIFTQF